MRTAGILAAWIGLFSGVIAATHWAIERFVLLPAPAPAPIAIDASSAPGTESMSAASPSERADRPVVIADGEPHRQDPSIDSAVLERAFQPPPRSLPSEAKPKAAALTPPEREWRRLRRQSDATAY